MGAEGAQLALLDPRGQFDLIDGGGAVVVLQSVLHVRELEVGHFVTLRGTAPDSADNSVSRTITRAFGLR
ncbi:hypothetical protein OHA79_06830 [Streptomyces sp. NBC_00841]|uniref:hypothetical protein n=1 Tax=unclassified Streptomyces TaxID=2593676 RepID=UPI0022568AF1|nr:MULTISPECIES: hypothetical protein [unclassified Streptomyces]MCX4537167.1 hypothetical protein [Streptomyces sp. NBC_01669]WRZ97599.1 hypothetical protein OHA79_06830 [Streptomyces sp. NBC_00841]